jgi:hypothetical protein
MTNEEYEQKIKSYGWKELEELWNKICYKTTNQDGWADGKALEYFTIRGFELSKAEVTYPYNVDLPNGVKEQIDGAVYVDGISAIFECKDKGDKYKVNFEPIAKLYAYLERRNSPTIGCLVSMSGYTEPAMVLADYLTNRTVLLWEKVEIEHALNKRNFSYCLKAKYRYSVEQGTGNINVVLISKL